MSLSQRYTPKLKERTLDNTEFFFKNGCFCYDEVPKISANLESDGYVETIPARAIKQRDDLIVKDPSLRIFRKRST